MIHYLGLRHVSYTEERRSSRRARVQEELNMIHYPRAAACLFARLRAEESSDFIEAHCGVPSREKTYEIVIYLYVCSFFRLPNRTLAFEFSGVEFSGETVLLCTGESENPNQAAVSLVTMVTFVT